MRRRRIVRQFKRDRFIQVIAVLWVVLIALALIGPAFMPDPNHGNIINRLAEPSWLGGDGGLLGTDALGRSVATRIVYGLRTSYIVGVGTVLLGGAIGATLGTVAGYIGGKTDTVIMRLTDLQLSMPGFILIMAIVVVTGGGILTLIFALGLTSWMLYARFARSLVLSYRSTDFIVASRSRGAGPLRIVGRHLFPNIVGPLIAVASLQFAWAMLAEAALSFLGFGVQPPTISVGQVMAGGRDYLMTQWWITTFAGIALALAVLTFNVLGSWLERVSDPRFERTPEAAPTAATVTAGGPA